MAKSNRKGIGCLGFIGLLAGGFIAILMITLISESSATNETSNVALATAFLIPDLAGMWFLLRNAYGSVYDNVIVPDKIDVSDITPISDASALLQAGCYEYEARCQQFSQ